MRKRQVEKKGKITRVSHRIERFSWNWSVVRIFPRSEWQKAEKFAEKLANEGMDVRVVYYVARRRARCRIRTESLVRVEVRK